mgnify:CR=1 FL=1
MSTVRVEGTEEYLAARRELPVRTEGLAPARGVLRAQMVLRETRKREGGTTKKPAPQPVPTANIKPRAVAAPFLPGVRPSQKAKP